MFGLGEVSLDVAPSRSGRRLKWGCLLAIFLAVGLVYGIYLYFHPYDKVVIEVRDVPADTTFVCLVVAPATG